MAALKQGTDREHPSLSRAGSSGKLVEGRGLRSWPRTRLLRGLGKAGPPQTRPRLLLPSGQQVPAERPVPVITAPHLFPGRGKGFHMLLTIKYMTSSGALLGVATL